MGLWVFDEFLCECSAVIPTAYESIEGAYEIRKHYPPHEKEFLVRFDVLRIYGSDKKGTHMRIPQTIVLTEEDIKKQNVYAHIYDKLRASHKNCKDDL